MSNASDRINPAVTLHPINHDPGHPKVRKKMVFQFLNQLDHMGFYSKCLNKQSINFMMLYIVSVILHKLLHKK